VEKMRTTKPKPRHQARHRPVDDRTKFDKWLERCRNDLTRVTFEFAIQPMHDFEGLTADCMVVDVDRYMLLLEFPLGETWWVSKGIISAAAVTEDAKP
jgi:hypothetical protein